MTKRKLTLEQARNQYPHRFTAEHVPHWAKAPLEGGKHYAPQYRTDAEWYANTAFPGEPNHPLPGDHACYSTGQTFPHGPWLAEPYRKGKEPKPWQAPIAKGFSRWAAFVGTANGQQITLHEDEISALLVVADALELLSPEEDAGKADPDIEELRERIEEHCNEGADDWYVQELEILDIPRSEGAAVMPRWTVDHDPARRLYHLQQALHSLKDAQELIRMAQAPYVLLKVKAARRSLEGAIRHAQGREHRQDHTRTVTKATRPRRIP